MIKMVKDVKTWSRSRASFVNIVPITATVPNTTGGFEALVTITVSNYVVISPGPSAHRNVV